MITGRVLIQQKSALPTKRTEESRSIMRMVQQAVRKADDRKVQVFSARAHGRQPRMHIAILALFQQQFCPFAARQLAHLLLDDFGDRITTEGLTLEGGARYRV